MYIKEMPSPSPFNIMPKAFSPLINKIQEAIFKIKTVAINKISFAPPLATTSLTTLLSPSL